MTPYTQEVEEALKPTAEQYDAARMLTEAAFSEDPHGRTMMVAKWIAARDLAIAEKAKSEALDEAAELVDGMKNDNNWIAISLRERAIAKSKPCFCHRPLKWKAGYAVVPCVECGGDSWAAPAADRQTKEGA